VSAAEVSDLLGGQFPRLRGAPVQPLATGWDSTVFLVDRRWVFRFPRREVALAGMRREIAVLPLLAGRLPLPVPVPELIGTPSAAFPWPFWGARLLPGVELAEAGLPDVARGAAAHDVGRFLAEIGGVLPVDPLRRGDPGRRAAMARERLDRLVRAGVRAAEPAVEALLARAERLGPDPAAPVVVHGDLHARHLLLDGDGGAAAVIDWGDLCLADPAVDLSLAYSGFAGRARAALLAEYGVVRQHTAVRARALAVFLAAALADYAVVEGRDRLLGESLAALRRAVARPDRET
jgi:aminoglycoside phosphotransferase (APT) family kinase protein